MKYWKDEVLEKQITFKEGRQFLFSNAFNMRLNIRGRVLFFWGKEAHMFHVLFLDIAVREKQEKSLTPPYFFRQRGVYCVGNTSL